jgi:hypothetical protein
MTQPVSWFPRIFNPAFELSMTALLGGKVGGRADACPLLSSPGVGDGQTQMNQQFSAHSGRFAHDGKDNSS